MARQVVTELLEENQQALHNALGSQGGTQDAGRAILAYIIERTHLGRDVHQVRFVPYAESTRRRKRRKGQRLQPVSLRDTEEMLQSMEVIPDERSFSTTQILSTIRFRGRRNNTLARIHSDPQSPRSKIPLRQFFGMDETDDRARIIGKQMGIEVRTRIPSDRRRLVKLNVWSIKR